MLIQHGLALCGKGTSYEALPLDLRVEDGRITACGKDLPPLSGEECFSAAGLLLMPGLVNAHVHSYTNLLKGVSFGEPLELWSLGTVALGAAMSLDDMALSAQLGIAEMLRYGVTACIDHIPHPGSVYSVAEVYRAAGFRAALAPMLHDRSDHLVLDGVREELPPGFATELRRTAGIPISERIAQYEQWIRDLHRPKETVSMMVGINAPQRCTEALMGEAGALAKKHGLAVHMHLRETAWQADSDIAESIDSLDKAAQACLLHSRTSLAHCVHLTGEHMNRIAEAGATVVHNPTSNLFLGSGTMPIGQMRSIGIKVAFGSDGCNCATSHNLLEIARTAMLLERSRQSDPALWQPLSGWYNGLTSDGWSAMGFAEPAGELRVGAPADIVFCGTDNAALLPLIDIPMQFLVNQSAPDVIHVMIDGKFALKDKKILVFDETSLYETLREKSSHLRPTFQTAISAAGRLRPSYERAFSVRLKNGRY